MRAAPGGVPYPSTRVKDLVDLTLIASTQTLDGAALRTAIAVGAAHRGLALPERFTVPDLAVWRAGYPAKAADVPGRLPASMTLPPWSRGSSTPSCPGSPC